MTKEFSLPDVDSLEEVPEAFRAFYFEKDGKVVKQNPSAMASTMAKIRRENEKLSAERAEFEKKLKAYTEALGEDADPEIIRTLKEKAQRADAVPTDDEIKKRIAIIEENFKKQIALKEKELSESDAIIQQELIAGQIREALKQAEANQDGLDILPEILRRRVEVQRLGNGRIKLLPLDEDETRMYAEDGSEASLSDLVSEIRSKRAIFFNGSKGNGLGAGGTEAQLPKDAKNWLKMTAIEKSEFMKKHGMAAVTAMIQRATS